MSNAGVRYRPGSPAHRGSYQAPIYEPAGNDCGGHTENPMSATAYDVSVGGPHAQTSRRPESPRFATGVATVFGGQLLCALFALGIEICYARLLGPGGKGQTSLCLMIIGVGAAIAGFGGEVPLTLWIAERKKNWSEWLPAVWFWGLAGCFAVSGLWAVIYWKWHPVFLRGITTRLAELVLVAVPLCVFFQYLEALFAGLERFRPRAALGLVSQAAELAGVAGLVFLVGRTAEMAVMGNLLGLLGAGLVGTILLKECFRDWWKIGPAAGRLGAVVSLGMMGQFSGMAMFFSYRLDVFVVNYFLGPAQLGLYALGVVVAESLWQVSSAVAVTLFPRTARTLNERTEQFTCVVTRSVFLVIVVLGTILAIVSPVVVPLVFGARFEPSVHVIRWILPGIVALGVGKVMAADLTARGKPKYNVLFAFISGTLAVILDFVLIPRMGIQGAALASSVTYVLLAFLTAFTLKHFLGATWKSLLLPSASDFAAYRAVWLRLRSPFANSAVPSPRGTTRTDA
jgi:O-antigen/teichoic acid export membrane protein